MLVITKGQGLNFVLGDFRNFVGKMKRIEKFLKKYGSQLSALVIIHAPEFYSYSAGILWVPYSELPKNETRKKLNIESFYCTVRYMFVL
jgi:hypothetical protein